MLVPLPLNRQSSRLAEFGGRWPKERPVAVRTLIHHFARYQRPPQLAASVVSDARTLTLALNLCGGGKDAAYKSLS